MLGPDVVVAKLQRLAERELEDLLRPRCERRRACRCRNRWPDCFLDLLADGLDRDVERSEDSRSDPLALVDETEEDVLGSDEAVVEEPRLFLSEDQNPACPIGEAFEYGPILSPPAAPRLGS